MKRILVPVDGSENALRALRHAIGRARESQAEVHVLHVDPPPHYEEARVYAVRDDIARIHQQARQRLLQDAVGELQKEKVPHAAHLAEGQVARAIADFAQAQRMDEIIMGTRGMSAFGQVMLGSVANRVVHWVTMPVTLVK